MNALKSHLSFRRAVAWLVMLAMLLPTLNGCVTASPPVIRLDGVVVDGQRKTADGEAGWVRIVRDGATMDGHAGMQLFPGDRVETGARAEAVIRFPSGSEVLMRPNSGGRIGSFTDIVGEVFIKVKGIFSADTTFVKAGARGTQYLVHESPGGTTYIVVFEGSVLVESTRASWAPVTMHPGEATFAYPQAPQPYRASVEELRRTQDWVERLERAVPPQTTVSTTGVLVGVGIAAAVAAILSSGGGGGGDRRPTPSTVSDRPPASAGPSTTSAPGTVVTPPRGAPTSVPSGPSTPTGRTTPASPPSSNYTPPTRTPAPTGRTAPGLTAPSRTAPSSTTTSSTPKATPAASVPPVRSRAATSAVVRRPTPAASSATPTPIR